MGTALVVFVSVLAVVSMIGALAGLLFASSWVWDDNAKEPLAWRIKRQVQIIVAFALVATAFGLFANHYWGDSGNTSICPAGSTLAPIQAGSVTTYACV